MINNKFSQQSSKFITIISWQFLHFTLIYFGNCNKINFHITWINYRCTKKGKLGIFKKFSKKPNKGLFKLIIVLNRNIIIFKMFMILLPLCLNFFNRYLSFISTINFISNQNNRYIPLMIFNVIIPQRNSILISNFLAYIKHYDCTMSICVVISKWISHT